MLHPLETGRGAVRERSPLPLFLRIAPDRANRSGALAPTTRKCGGGRPFRQELSRQIINNGWVEPGGGVGRGAVGTRALTTFSVARESKTGPCSESNWRRRKIENRSKTRQSGIAIGGS